MTWRRIVVRMPSEVVEALDRAARERDVARAELVRGAVGSLYPGVCRTLPDLCASSAVASTPCDAGPLPECWSPTAGILMQRKAPQTSLRERILTVMSADPDAVFTPARLAPAISWGNRNSIRNTLLVLAGKGKIEKVGAGQYRWPRPEPGQQGKRQHGADEADAPLGAAYPERIGADKLSAHARSNLSPPPPTRQEGGVA